MATRTSITPTPAPKPPIIERFGDLDEVNAAIKAGQLAIIVRWL
ncbi:hypothetical protein [Azospirillum sp. ST 5-10]